MGRSRTKTKTGRSLPTNKTELKQPSTSKAPEPSIPSLLAKIQQLVTRCEYDLALKFTTRVLERDPNNLEAMETLGTVTVEMGDLDARPNGPCTIFLGSSVNIAPSRHSKIWSTLRDLKTLSLPPSAHLYLAQLEEEDPRNALEHYQTSRGYHERSSKVKGDA